MDVFYVLTYLHMYLGRYENRLQGRVLSDATLLVEPWPLDKSIIYLLRITEAAPHASCQVDEAISSAT